MMYKNNEAVMVNGTPIQLNPSLTCKSSNIIYLLQCPKCKPTAENSYFGQTRNECHCRMNGHRTYFKDDPKIYEKSAAALHAYTAHDPPLDLTDFKCAIVKQTSHAVQLDREEFRYIEKHKTNFKGLNRCKVKN